MLSVITDKTAACEAFLKKLETRGAAPSAEVVKTVTDILEDVRQNGDAALLSYTERFDRVKLTAETLEMKKDALEAQADKVPENLKKTILRAAENIRRYHEKQLRQSFFDTSDTEKLVGMRITPKKRAGVYVPGGSAAYPSSVLMNVIPAKVAGVEEIIMTTPLRDGEIPPAVAFAALVAGVDRVFLCGGAQAIAALAYGTQSVPRVDVIAGPGNIYVATAKRLVYGACDIDMIAGPSEVLVIADSTADPAFAAADLLSQAEHDPLASPILLTDDARLAEAVAVELEKQVARLSRSDIAARSVAEYGAAIVCSDIEDCFTLAARIAPEHLELLTAHPLADLSKVQNAGSIFVGAYSPEPLGDYFAGPNHVLPTGGTARFASPLSVDTFIKKSGVICYTKAGLAAYRDDIIRFAESEGLGAHAASVRVRFETEDA